MTHDLFGTPLPISGNSGILFELPESPSPRGAESEPLTITPPRRWPPPWHAETSSDRRIKRQYRSEATVTMF
jgi:hypothetical protein